MLGKKVVSDYEINAGVRRELSARGLDVSQLRYRCHGGTVEIGGVMKFKEPKSPAQIIKELHLIDTAISGIRGVRRVKIQVDGFEKTTGKWTVANKKDDEKKDRPGGD